MPARAQGLDGNDAPGSDQNSPICMARPHDAVAQVRPEQRGKPFHILAVQGSVAGLEAKGFSIVDCAKAKLGQQGQVKRYRDTICELASKGNEAVQNQLERALGERPATLCANAQVIAGRWQRGQSSTE
ncbi:hypothetical protein ACI5KX_14085 [Erythrobacter sp. GH1-10]|uniref:hypothetical protein n=1 Tax=Erythrobacter sp. GH1-10 TaxID=3349334 RepID=UPI0038780EEA